MNMNGDPLIPAIEFIKSGACPVSFYHLVFNEKEAMLEDGAIVRNGKRWLVDPPRFFDYLRTRGRK